MGRLRVLHGTREQLMAYLRSHPEVERLSLLISEGEDGAECVDISGAETPAFATASLCSLMCRTPCL